MLDYFKILKKESEKERICNNCKHWGMIDSFGEWGECMIANDYNETHKFHHCQQWEN